MGILRSLKRFLAFELEKRRKLRNFGDGVFLQN